MTSKILQELLKSTAFLGVLLLIGLYLRARFPYSDVSWFPRLSSADSSDFF